MIHLELQGNIRKNSLYSANRKLIGTLKEKRKSHLHRVPERSRRKALPVRSDLVTLRDAESVIGDHRELFCLADDRAP